MRWTRSTELLAGGKRLRAGVLLLGLARRAAARTAREIFAAAAALELLHASALVHDDVMDGSDTRRGQPAVHRRFAARHAAARLARVAEAFGTGAAILLGDLLLTWTDEMLARLRPAADAALARGRQVLDRCAPRSSPASSSTCSARRRADASVGQRAAGGRATSRPSTPSSGRCTSAPPSAGPQRAAATRPVTAGASPATACRSARRSSCATTCSASSANPAETGKPAGDDLREGKRTVLLAIARERADGPRREVLDRCVGDPLLTEDRRRPVRAVITGTGALAECEQMIDASVAEALSALDGRADHRRAKGALAELAVTATARSGLPGQKASAWARRFTSVQRCSVIAWIGRAGQRVVGREQPAERLRLAESAVEQDGERAVQTPDDLVAVEEGRGHAVRAARGAGPPAACGHEAVA